MTAKESCNNDNENVQETTEQQFVLFEILRLENVNKKFKKSFDDGAEAGENEKGNTRTYEKVRFFFHSWYKRYASYNPFIIGSKTMTIGKSCIQLHEFIEGMIGKKITLKILEEMSFEEMHRRTKGLNVMIEHYKDEKMGTVIKKILPVPPDADTLNIKPGIKVPEYLINRPVHKKQYIGFDDLFEENE